MKEMEDGRLTVIKIIQELHVNVHSSFKVNATTSRVIGCAQKL